MSEGSYLKADVMCPFYLSDDRRRVLCEGVMQGAVTVQQFRRREDLERFMRLRCCRRYRLCAVYAGLMTKYEEEEP